MKHRHCQECLDQLDAGEVNTLPTGRQVCYWCASLWYSGHDCSEQLDLAI